MRFAAPFAAAVLLAFQGAPVLAQTSPATPPPATTTPSPAPMAPAPMAPAPMAPAPMAPAPMAPAPMAPSAPPGAISPTTKPHRPHVTLAQRFAAANTSHDGHLTREQADAASWKYVSRNFAAIDKDHQGYVTVEDIRAYARANRAARHHTPKNSAPATTPVPEAPAAPAGGTGTSD